MKILIITVRSDISGGPKHIVDLISQSQSIDSQFQYFIAAPAIGAMSQELKSLSSSFISLPYRSFSIFKLISLLYFVKKNHIGVIHSHGRGAGIYSRPMKLFGRRVIHTFHGIHNPPGIIGKIKIFLDRILKHFTDSFICVSPDELDMALDLKIIVKEKAKIILNGVKIQKNRCQLFSAGGTLHFSNLSRMTYQKGLDLLLKGVSSLPNLKDHSFDIEIGGDGEEKSKIQKSIESLRLNKVIHLRGMQNDPSKFLLKSNAYISYSRWEGLPLSVLEAMSIGLPCLLSDIPGHQIFKEYKAALMFDIDSYEDFHQKLLLFISDHKLREQLARRGPALIENKLNREKMAIDTIELYKNILKKGVRN